MHSDILSLFGHEAVIANAYPMSDLDIFVIKDKCSLLYLDELMAMDWVIMSTWIEDEH